MEERFIVRYVVEWGDSPRERFFPSLSLAEEFANGITTDGTTAFPNVAIIIRRTREHDLGVWQDDQSFGSIEISRGKRVGEPSNTNPG